MGRRRNARNNLEPFTFTTPLHPLGAADDLIPRRLKRIGLGSGLGSGLHRGAVMRTSETCIRTRMTSGRNGSGCRLWSDGTRA